MTDEPHDNTRPVTEQRVSDERVQEYVDNHAGGILDLALDMQDCRVDRDDARAELGWVTIERDLAREWTERWKRIAKWQRAELAKLRIGETREKALGSQLLSVQQDCIAEHNRAERAEKRVVELEALKKEWDAGEWDSVYTKYIVLRDAVAARADKLYAQGKYTEAIYLRKLLDDAVAPELPVCPNCGGKPNHPAKLSKSQCKRIRAQKKERGE